METQHLLCMDGTHTQKTLNCQLSSCVLWDPSSSGGFLCVVPRGRNHRQLSRFGSRGFRQPCSTTTCSGVERSQI